MVKFILIKSPDEWATTKQAWTCSLFVFFLHIIYFALLLCIEHCSMKIKCMMGTEIDTTKEMSENVFSRESNPGLLIIGW